MIIEHFAKIKLDKLMCNCDCIREDCFKNKNDKLIKNLDQLLKSARFVDEITYDFAYKNVPANGFLIFLKIPTSYSDLIVNEIEKKSKIEDDLLKQMKAILLYEEWILVVYKLLVNQAKDKFNNNLLDKNDKFNQIFMVKSRTLLSSTIFYKVAQ